MVRLPVEEHDLDRGGLGRLVDPPGLLEPVDEVLPRLEVAKFMSTSEIVNAEKVEEKACSNCKKLIEVPKLRLHESTCRRNTIKCGKC